MLLRDSPRAVLLARLDPEVLFSRNTPPNTAVCISHHLLSFSLWFGNVETWIPSRVYRLLPPSQSSHHHLRLGIPPTLRQRTHPEARWMAARQAALPLTDELLFTDAFL